MRQHIDEQAWQEALLHELKRYADLLQVWQKPRRLESIFFGGGTPSLMKPQTVETILKQAEIMLKQAGTILNSRKPILVARPGCGPLVCRSLLCHQF